MCGSITAGTYIENANVVNISSSNANDEYRPKLPHKLPFERNAHFTGRLETLENIHTTFQSEGNVSLKQTIAGLGGVGKTQTALEYAYLFSHEYEYIWWFRSETESEFFDDIRNFVVNNCGADKDISQEDMHDVLFAFLQKNKKWLFIYDNVEDFDFINKWIPITTNGHILVTTRDVVKCIGKTINIDVFTEDESIKFLEQRTELKDKANAKLLSSRLGFLPLALEQAAAYIAETPSVDFIKYLDLLKEYGLTVFDKSKPTDYSKTVKTTWDISLKKIESKGVAIFLEMCSFLAPDNIPLELFIQGCEKLPDELKSLIQDNLERLELVKTLTRYSLMKTKDGVYFSMHRLLQEVIRDSSLYVVCCVDMLKSVFDYEYGNSERMKTFAENVPHVLSTIDYASKQLSIDSEELRKISDLYQIAGYGYEFSSQFRQALDCYNNALSLMKKALKTTKHPSVAKLYSRIAGIYERKEIIVDDYKTALDWHEKAKNIKSDMLGVKHPDTADSYVCIADIYNANDKSQQALDLLSDTLDIRIKSLNDSKQKLATCHYNMAKVYIKKKDYKAGLSHSKEALKIDMELFGEDNPIVAIDRTNVAEILFEEGEFDESLKVYLQAYKVFLTLSGEEHYNTIITKESMKKVYSCTDNFEPFENWLKRKI